MAWDSRDAESGIDELGGPDRGARATLRAPRRWIPLLVVGGLAILIVGAGLLGPKAPGQADASPPATRAAVPSASAAAPPGTGDAEAATAAPARVPVAATPVPELRLGGPPLADPYVLLGGRWVDAASGAVGGQTGCELERPLVLAGGRIVCVASEVTRSPGSRQATYELAAVTLGRARTPPAAGWGSAPPAAPDPGARSRLLTLVGRRDLVVGAPVAIAAAPGTERDSLVLAWAVIGPTGYQIGLARFTIDDARAVGTGSRDILFLPLEDERGPVSLADLAVAVSPDGSQALVGVTVAAAGGPAERRLLVVGMAGAVVGDGAIAAPLALSPRATENRQPAADAPCGGVAGEGFGGPGTVYVVCPGLPAEVRVLGVGADATGTEGPDALVSSLRLEPAETQLGTAWLAGNGVVSDFDRAVVYRWSPASGTLWRIAFAAEPDGVPRIDALLLPPRRGYLDIDAAAGGSPQSGPRPILTLDPARGRLYALDAPLPRSDGISVIHLVDVAAWSHFGSFFLADSSTRAIALSPDGSLLYASTQPRPVGSPPSATGVEILDAMTGAERAFVGRLRVGIGTPIRAAVVR